MRRMKHNDIPVVKAQVLRKQGMKCPLCDIPLTMETACLDHDHENGHIRDNLCRNCNGSEGRIKNLVTRSRRGMPHKDWLGRLILYWIRHETNQHGLYHPTHKTENEKRLLRNKKARARRAKAKTAK